MIDKREVRTHLVTRLESDLADLERRQRDVVAGATHEESRSEHAKDTRATEQSYLARGLADRVADLERTLEAVRALPLRDLAPGESIGVGALVQISGEGSDGREETTLWFVVPGAGGIELDVGGTRVRTVTPVSPMGRSLLGLAEGDEGRVRRPRGDHDFEVTRVR